MSPHMLEHLTPSRSCCLGRIRVWLVEVGCCKGWGLEISFSVSQSSLALVWRALPLTPTTTPSLLMNWDWKIFYPSDSTDTEETAHPTPPEVHCRKSNRQSHVLPRTRECSNWWQCSEPEDWVLIDVHLKQKDVLCGFLNYVKDTGEFLKQFNQGLQENQLWIIDWRQSSERPDTCF